VKGDVIEVELATKAPTDYELVIAGDAGVSMRLRDEPPVTAAEVTRLFILGEAMRWVHDGMDWVCTALDDGRIPSYCGAWLSKAVTGETASVATVPTDKGGAWTLFEDNAEIARLATSGIRIRRANTYSIQQKGLSSSAASGAYLLIGIKIGAIAITHGLVVMHNTTQHVVYGAHRRKLSHADFVQYYYATSGSKGLSAGDNMTYFFFLEQF
jgi:hypothetical protein